jgi:hypothetical protein
VLKAFGEQRPDRPVNEAAGENFLFGRAAFALDEAAGEAPGCVGVLAVIDRERKEACAGFRVRIRAGGDKDNRVAGADNYSAVGLLGHFARFKCDYLAVEVNLYGMSHGL